VVHRLQRWFALLLSSVWVTVLAVIGVVVIASAVGRRYIDWPADPWEATSSAQELWLLAAAFLLAALLFLAALLAQTAFRRLRTEAERAEENLGPAEDIRIEPHTRPVEVTVEPHRDDTLTFTVRLEPHRDPGTQTLQVMAP
jgi:H+/Cl- antiporter ClcA